MITANFNTYASYVTDSLYQWDLNQVLSVSGLNLSVAPEVHFANANMDKAIVKQAELINHVVKVQIPNSLLQEPLTIKAYIGIYEADTFKIIETVSIPVKPKAKPSDYRIENTDGEIYSFEALKNAIANMVKSSDFENDKATIQARIDNIIAHNNDTEGNTELIDMRTGADGKVYTSAGEAIRKQINILQGERAIKLENLKLNIDFTNKRVILSTINTSILSVIYGEKNRYQYLGEMSATCDISGLTNETYCFVFNSISQSIKVVRLTRHFESAIEYNRGDFVLFVAQMNASNIVNLIYKTENNVYINDVEYLDPVSFSSDAVGTLWARIDIDTVNKTLSHTSGYIFFNNNGYKVGNSEKVLDYTSIDIGEKGETLRIVYDNKGELKVKKLADITATDCLLMEIWFTNNNFDFTSEKIFAAQSIKEITYIDGVVLSESIKSLTTKVTNAQNKFDVISKITGINKNTCKIFKKVCCCGDSFTSGHMTDSDGTTHTTNEDYAYPHYMSTLTGNNWINCGHSGANVLTWQTLERGLPKAKTTGKVQAYIIGLMINDQSDTDRHVDIGTIDDIGTENQTYYGGMSAIIRELNAISPKAKIFICTCPNSSNSYSEYNKAIYDIVNFYRDTYPVHCLDLLANIDLYQIDSLTDDSKDGHYTAIGYEQFSEILSVIMSDYINNNITDFQDVAFIEYDE